MGKHNNHNHGNDHHKNHQQKAKEQAAKVEERLDEKTLHAHRKAIPQGEGTPPPHEEHVGHEQHEEHGGHGGHHNHHQMMIENFKRRFWVSLFLSFLVIVFSPMVQHILGYSLGIEASYQLC